MRRAVSGVVLMCGLAPVLITVPSAASSPRIPPRCTYDQLEVAVAWGPGAAAGNIGIPFLIANVSRSACSIEGYPKLEIAPGTYKKGTMRVIRGGGMVFPSVKPRLVVLKPGGDASFGLDYGDASNQQDPYGAPCMVQNIYVSLPVRVSQFPQNYETTVNFNFCYANFEVAVTSLQAGPLPKEG